MAVGSRERAVARPPPAAVTAVTAASAQGRSHLMPGSEQPGGCGRLSGELGPDWPGPSGKQQLSLFGGPRRLL